MNLEKKLVCLMVVASLFVMSGVIAVTDTGTVSLTITSVTQVTFTTGTIAFGTGSVTAGQTSATLDTEGTVTNGGWSAVTAGFVLENTGTEDVSLNIESNKDAATLIDGASPSFKWKMSNGEDGSCLGITDTSYTTVTSTSGGKTICSTFYADNAKDVLEIDFELVIPSDAPAATDATATITATATAA
jgi:hypothetical protein